MAKMMGLGPMLLTISWVKAPFFDRPRITSLPLTASSRVRALVSVACADFHWFMPSVRPR